MNPYQSTMARRSLWCAVLAVLTLAGETARAHEGHSHAEPAMASMQNQTSTRRSFSGAGEALELTVVYDTATAKGGASIPLRLLLADKATNEPVDGATLDLTLSGGNADVGLTAEKAGTSGAYTTTANLTEGIQYSLLVDASKGDVSDFFSVDKIALPGKMPSEPAHEAEHQEQPWPGWLPWVGLSVAVAIVGFLAGRSSRHGQKAGA